LLEPLKKLKRAETTDHLGKLMLRAVGLQLQVKPTIHMGKVNTFKGHGIYSDHQDGNKELVFIASVTVKPESDVNCKACSEDYGNDYCPV